MDEAAASKLLRLEACRVSVERETAEIQAKDKDMDPASVESEHRCIEYSGLIGNELLLERETNEAHVIFKQHASGKPKQIDIDMLEQALLGSVFSWSIEPDRVKVVLAAIVEASVKRDGCATGIGFTQFANLRNLFVDALIKEACSEYPDRDQALFHLLREHSRLGEVIKLVRDEGAFGAGETRFLFQLVAWSHAVLLSQYHSGINLTTLDTLDQVHVAFALVPWVQVLLTVKSCGWDSYFFRGAGAAEAMYVWGTVLCLIVALIGVIILETESYDNVSLGTARFCMSFASGTIFTQNIRFNQMIQRSD